MLRDSWLYDGLREEELLDGGSFAGAFGAERVLPMASEEIRKPTRAVAIATMAKALRQAGRELGHEIDDTLLSLMLGQMLGAEGSMPGLWQGGGYTFRGTNNIGAAQVPGGATGRAFEAAKAPTPGWGAFAHKDSNPGGDEYIGWYYMAPSALEAARHWLTGYAGTKAVLAQSPHDAQSYARIMCRAGYFTGLSHDTDKEIAAYAKRIQGAAPPPSVMNGPANDPAAVSVDPSQFDTLEKRKITEALFNKAKSGKSGSAWAFLLPTSWDALVASNGVVWFGQPPSPGALAGRLGGALGGPLAGLTAWMLPTGGLLAGALLGGLVGGPAGVFVGGAAGAGAGWLAGKLGLPAVGTPPVAVAPAMMPAAVMPTPASAPTPAPASPAADTVKRAQTRLSAMGYGPLKADGIIGPKTKAAIMSFQRARKLPMTGTLDAATARALGGQA